MRPRIVSTEKVSGIKYYLTDTSWNDLFKRFSQPNNDEEINILYHSKYPKFDQYQIIYDVNQNDPFYNSSITFKNDKKKWNNF